LSGPFATATEFCEYTGLPVPSDLARLQFMLAAASAEIRGFTGQMLSEVVGDVVVLGACQRDTLLLPERPVTAITLLTVSGTPYTDYRFTRPGLIKQGATESTVEGTFWSYGATVTYNHGYTETSDAFAHLRQISIDVAARAFTLNERSASEAMGSTLMESAGYSPEIFLTQGEKWKLMDLGQVLVG